MDLIIVESPTKAKTLSRFLGKGFDVEATMGHVKDLPKSKLGIDVEHDFAPELVSVPKREATIKKLLSKSKKAKLIYIATDPDREGEAIAAHVHEILNTKSKTLNKTKTKNSNIKRITFHEITKHAVEDALKHSHEIDNNLVDAQTSRRVLDRLVGYKLSPLLWKKVRRGLSAGRVQSVAVKLIVEKEKEIEKFKAEEYWEIYVNLKTQNPKLKHGEFTTQLIKIGDKKADVKNKRDADSILSDLDGADYKVSDVRKREVTKNPYPPFITSTLQQTGSRVLGWSSKKTMSIAQKLYEEGLITYHRTDSLNLSSEAVKNSRSYIEKTFGRDYLPEKPRFYKTKSKVAQEAHEAIRPTDVGQIPNDNLQIPNDEKRLYDLIWRRFMACQMNSARYAETSIDVAASTKYKVPSTKYLLRASGQIMIFDGWRKLFPRDSEVVIFPDIEQGAGLTKVKVWGDQKFTQPPARYNEASLIKIMEKLGIGRPSTYAPTISTIQLRNYVEKNESKQFVPTTIGIAVNEFLLQNFAEIIEYEFTAGMEQKLDEIANGKLAWVREIKDFYKPFEKKISSVEKNAKRVKIEVEKLGRKCPECKEGELVIRTGRFGRFISCSRFPDCRHTEKLLEKIGFKCPDCDKGEVIVKKTGKGLPAGRQGRKFFGCSRYPDCKFASWKNPKLQKETKTPNG
jgi:DNA topoisomerase I